MRATELKSDLADTIDEERAEYDSRYSHVTSADFHMPNHVVAPEERKLWDQYVGNIAGKSVLECGSGDGYLTVWLANQGANVTAVELSPVGVSKIMERAESHGLHGRVQAICADCCDLDSVIPPNSIDIVLGFAVLHHLPLNRIGTVLSRILKPGGRALFLENSNANPFYRLGRRIYNNESPSGAPLKGNEVDALITLVGGGEKVYPRFGLFGLDKEIHISAKQSIRCCC
jgi:2-polyprenyl-3-methyl-5-hydroxy-6-metoxy-1,4-benzoquinol methylase